MPIIIVPDHSRDSRRVAIQYWWLTGIDRVSLLSNWDFAGFLSGDEGLSGGGGEGVGGRTKKGEAKLLEEGVGPNMV